MKNKYRPKLHYTPFKGWINDPNGLVFDETNKTYHLFAQYSKGIENDGIYGWIHATSKDLFNWEEKDIPILSNCKGMAWSGGAVVDYHNTSGLFDDSIPGGSRMLCFVTYQSTNPKIGIVYSLDQGEHWKEYPEFVIKNENNCYSNEFRDPKVIWYKNKELTNGGKWVLIVGGFTTIKLFSSDNLLSWKFESEILDKNNKTVNSECPDIFALKVDDSNDIKYVVSTGGTSYIVGDLIYQNGKIIFVGGQDAKKMFLGPKLWTCRGELYATQSFFNDKNVRVILLSWVVDRTASLLPEKNWNGAESLPMEARLIKRRNEYLLNLYPVEELLSQRKEKLFEINDYYFKDNEPLVIKNNNDNYDLEIELNARNIGFFEISLGGCSLIRYLEKESLLSFIYDKEHPPIEKKVNLIDDVLKLRIIVDASIVEIYVNDGEMNMHALCLFGDKKDLVIKVQENTKIITFSLYSL